MKAVLISIKPNWCELIASGKKTVEVRKTKPKLETPFKVYIYETQGRTETPFVDEEGHYIFKGRGQVIGEFVCKKVENIEIRHFTVFGHENRYTAVGETPDYQWLKKSCLSYNEVVDYGKLAPLYGWHISDLVIYDKPRELSEFIIPSKIGCCNEGKCRGCKYLDRGNGYNIEDDCNAKFSTDEFKPLRRPPQSWCYVEVEE